MNNFDFLSIREYFPSDECPSVSSWVYNQAIEIQKYGFNPLVISPTPRVPIILKKTLNKKHAWKTNHSNKILKYNDVSVIRPVYNKLPNKYFLDYNLRKASDCIYNIAKDFKVKLIHAHFGHSGISSLKLKTENKIPLITSFYGYDLGCDKNKLKKYYNILSKEGDLFLALSEDMKNDLIKLGFPEKKIKIHRLGVNVNFFSPQNNISEKKEKFIFTIVALFEEKKGIRFAIEAFKLLKRNHQINDCILRIVGDCRLDNKIKQLSEKDSNIVFINSFETNKPRELVLNEMQKCDVFVLTSITSSNNDKEGTPIVLMEAQACGKPCISTFHAGIPEVVINNKTGILVKEKDIEGIADAMFELYNNKDKRTQFGINARNQIVQSYNNEIQVRELYSIYKLFI